MSENSYLESYNSIIKKSKNLSAAEEKELFEKIKSSDPFISKRAREKIINNSLKLIIPLAQKFKTEKIDVGELFSIGLKGLIKSVGSFDPSKGFRFSTYATPNILQAITVYINQYNRFIRLPVNILADLRVINRVKNKLLYRFGSEPSNHDIFEELKNEGVKNITEEKINQYDSMVKNVYWIEESENDGDKEKKSANSNDVEDQKSSNIEEDESVIYENKKNVKKEKLRTILHKILTPQQYKIFCYRYGFDNLDKLSIEQIGKKMGFTKDTARGRIKKIDDIIAKNDDIKKLKEEE